MTDADGRYRTVAGRGRAAFEVRGSAFVGRVAPAGAVEDAEAFVERVRAEYADATHNVPAYRVRVDAGGPASGSMLREYESDAGEPTGSAGKPALNVLQGQDLEDVAAVVTRYHGGTNLGVGGLARAYGRAVKDAVDDAGVVEQRPRERFAVTADYDDSGAVRSVLESGPAEFDADYGERVAFDVEAAVADAEDVRDRIRSATSGRAEIESE